MNSEEYFHTFTKNPALPATNLWHFDPHFPQVGFSQEQCKLEGDFSRLISLSLLYHSLHRRREYQNVYISIAFHIIP